MTDRVRDKRKSWHMPTDVIVMVPCSDISDNQFFRATHLAPKSESVLRRTDPGLKALLHRTAPSMFMCACVPNELNCFMEAPTGAVLLISNKNTRLQVRVIAAKTRNLTGY